MENTIFIGKNLKVEIEPFEIPWVKVFTMEPYREFSECSFELRVEMLEMIDFCEKEMIKYFKPTKINIASFGNYLPKVHFHIQARFETDSYFPEPTWGTKMRTSNLELKLDEFYKYLKDQLERKK